MYSQRRAGFANLESWIQSGSVMAVSIAVNQQFPPVDHVFQGDARANGPWTKSDR